MAKGQKTGGRQKGSINKVTKDTKDRIDFVLGLLDNTIEQDIKLISPTERVKLFAVLQEYRIPKLARTEISGEITTMNVSQTTNYSVKSRA